RPFIGGDELFERGDHFVPQLFVETIGADHIEAGAHGDVQTEFINGGGVRVLRFGLLGQNAENFDVAGVDLPLHTGGRGDLRVDFAAHDGQNAFARAVSAGHAAQVPVVLLIEQLNGQVGLGAFTGDSDRQLFARVGGFNKILHAREVAVGGNHQGERRFGNFDQG